LNPSPAEASATGPRCVCGGELSCMFARDRARGFLSELHPVLRQEPRRLELIIDAQRAAGGSFFVCDVCEGSVPLDSAVWTCGNGKRTILHATSYDVCQRCFVRHAVGVDLLF